MMSAERGAAAHTLSSYRNDLDDFLSFLRQKSLSALTCAQDDVEAYLQSLSLAGLAASTRARFLDAHPPALSSVSLVT